MKLPPEILADILMDVPLDESVIVGPKIGEDFAAIVLPSGDYLVIHSDPITGATKYIGWYSVIVPSNDVATSGAIPKWILVNIMAPSEDAAVVVLRDVVEHSKRLNISLIGGHTEITPGIDRPIVSSTSLGISRKIIKTSGAKVGDAVIITKGAGIEGTAIIANDFEDLCIKKGISENTLKSAKEMLWEISILKEAKIASKYAHSMHDATEGGLLGALLEISIASRKIIRVTEEIPIREETREICEALGLNPLKLISSGTLVFTVDKEFAEEVIDEINSIGIEAYQIGVVEGEGVGVVLGKEIIREYQGEELDKLFK